MAAVSLDRLSKRYAAGHALAVDAVTLDVEHGEFMILLGPSGCGKSTTLRMIAGLEAITSGELSIDGRRVNDVPAKDRDIAMVFQSYALYPHMSVYDNLAFGLRRRAIPGAEIERRVRDAAATLGLAELLDRKPHASPAGSASGSRSAARSCAIPRCSCSTSRFPTSTRRSASACAASS